jgi:uncharacterized protein (TIGR03435 family)
MKKLLLWVIALAALAAAPLRAQDVTGQWQGTVHAGSHDLRLILKITKDDGHLKGMLYSIDQGAQPIKASSVTQDGSSVKVAVDMYAISFEGKLAADGKSIPGTWSQGPGAQPLTFALSTKETAWEIPAPPPPPKLMAADADPAFEVATIKPNNSGAASLQQLTVNGRDFKIVNGSLGDLIEFAYAVQGKQIIGAPDWLDKDRYDIAAVPDQEGAPNPMQVRIMMRKLLKERFQLTFHHDKREMSAFVLTVAKTGSKLQPTQLKGPLPGMFLTPAKGGGTLHLINGTIGDFCSFLQTLVLDRPVVDQTGLTGKFDLAVTFLPDETEFNGHPPFAKSADTAEAAPSLFDALQQQAGLKLTAEKTAVDVIAIDHVEKPSPN